LPKRAGSGILALEVPVGNSFIKSRRRRVMSISQHEGGSVALTALAGKTLVLLMKEISKPAPHFLKVSSETMEPGESIEHTAISGLMEEFGMRDLKTEVTGGLITKITDPRIASFEEVGERKWIEARRSHWQHRFLAVARDDDVIRGLADKLIVVKQDSEPDERIETTAKTYAELDELFREGKLLRSHTEFIRYIPYLVDARLEQMAKAS
jgi:hypothetical protein